VDRLTHWFATLTPACAFKPALTFSRAGIRERRILSEGETLTQLAAEAGRQARSQSVK
jgi:3-oxoacyl-[acyl-carrier-protein] synthase III